MHCTIRFKLGVILDQLMGRWRDNLQDIILSPLEAAGSTAPAMHDSMKNTAARAARASNVTWESALSQFPSFSYAISIFQE